MRVYFLMGTRDVPTGRDPLEILEQACQGGITCFQLREKGDGSLQGEKKKAFAKACQKICEAYGVPFIINDDVELALQLRPDGIHLGQEDSALRDARRVLDENCSIGQSVHTFEEAGIAHRAGADSIGVGAIFPTQSKANVSLLSDLSIIGEIKTAYPELPLVAIGGISEETTESVIKAGADGVAIITDIVRAEDVKEKVRRLRSLVDKSLQQK